MIAKFRATFPDIQSAVNISGTGFTRIKLDIPEEDLAEVMKLIGFGREQVLSITVEKEKESNSDSMFNAKDTPMVTHMLENREEIDDFSSADYTM